MSNGNSGRHQNGDRGRRAAAQRLPCDRDRPREIEHGAGHRSRPDTAGCPYCGGNALSRFGRTPRGAQRWHCRRCGRKHQATTGTALAGIRHPHKFNALLADMLGPEPSSCRTLARALALDKSTVWQWRQRAARGFGARDHAALTAPIASGLAVVRESRKASREWVNYRRAPAVHAAPDRLRWVDYPRLGLVAPDHLPRYRIPIEISVDQGGRRAAEVLDCLAAEHWPPANARPPASSIAPIALRAADSDTPPLATCEAAGETARLGARPQSDVGAADRGLAAFGRFLRPFRGPATRHLPAYVAWFVTRNNSGEIPGALISGCPASLPSPAPD